MMGGVAAMMGSGIGGIALLLIALAVLLVLAVEFKVI